jgi:hypothetical protein
MQPCRANGRVHHRVCGGGCNGGQDTSRPWGSSEALGSLPAVTSRTYCFDTCRAPCHPATPLHDSAPSSEGPAPCRLHPRRLSAPWHHPRLPRKGQPHRTPSRRTRCGLVTRPYTRLEASHLHRSSNAQTGTHPYGARVGLIRGGREQRLERLPVRLQVRLELPLPASRHPPQHIRTPPIRPPPPPPPRPPPPEATGMPPPRHRHSRP